MNGEERGRVGSREKCRAKERSIKKEIKVEVGLLEKRKRTTKKEDWGVMI